jgi:TM2 domain-containing membrane protein YozV
MPSEDESPDDAREATRTDAGPAPAGQKYCPKCGTLVDENVTYCPECGAHQMEAAGGRSGDKDRVAAGVLAILLGGLGAHHFYLGNIGLGVLYLCFSWTFIPALVGLIEGIIYLTKTDAEFERQYGS